MSKATNPIYFRVNKSELIKTLRRLKSGTPKKASSITTCELTLTNNLVTFTVPGATLGIKVESVGTAKASFNLSFFTKICSSFKKRELKIELKGGKINIETFEFNDQIALFENDSILRSVVLPYNYNDVDLLALYFSNRYTVDELKFNKLWAPIAQAEQRLRQTINEVAELLKPYGVTKTETQNILNEKIQLKVKSITESFNVNKFLQEKSQD